MLGGRFVIGFSGHRNCVVGRHYLDCLRDEFAGRDILWLHGGAIGFDSQVDRYAGYYGLCVREILPKYKLFGTYLAPKVRNKVIARVADLCIVCWDRRTGGGTYHFLQYALKLTKNVRYWLPTSVEF